MMMQLIRMARFSAAHMVPTSPSEAARRLHGHDWNVEVMLRGRMDEKTGWLIDFGQIADALAPVLDRLDHHCLNDIEGIEIPDNPSVERWIFDRLKDSLPMLSGIRLSIRGDLRFAPRHLIEDARLDLPRRVGFSIESAHSLPHSGEGHKCKRIHGHSFRVEVGSGSDVSRLEQHCRKIYDLLDHRYLNEIEGLENPTSENLAAWIWEALQGDVPDLSVVIVRESENCACIYRGPSG